MNMILFQTGNAVFEFNRKEVLEHLTILATVQHIDEAATILKSIKATIGENILNSDDHSYFGYVTVDLISAGKGSMICKACGKFYPADQLEPITIGHGASPFEINIKTKGGIKEQRKKNPSMFGGTGFQCPEGHTLISMETWRT